MPLPIKECFGKLIVPAFDPYSEPTELFFECIKVKKVFDEFGLRECVEGITFTLATAPVGGTIQPQLILRECFLSDPVISNATVQTGCNPCIISRRLRFSGKCCCEVFGKDQAGNIIRMIPTSIPAGTKFSIGPNGELCESFNVRRDYDDFLTFSPAAFDNLLHFIDEGRFELQCLSEAEIDPDNNVANGTTLITNLGMFKVVKFDTEVQLCVPVLAYCEVNETTEPGDFCDDFNRNKPFPDFNPEQLFDPDPYTP
jgi:hypothetical protein